MATNSSVAALVASLTREEKLRLVHGAPDPDREATGYVPGVERLGIEPLRLVDGPLGIRTNTKTATAFPASVAVAASFDTDLAERFGAALAREAAAYDQHVVLAPGVNLVRVPECGRNFEYFSEDPVVAGEIGAGVVTGIQSNGVLATVKHYVANNQETNRCDVSAQVDERTLRELYLRPFRRAVEADVGSVMTAYNRVNGTHMSDHEWLVGDVLKGEWGFEGFVVSDWHGTESTVGAANAGLDLEMPGIPATEMLDAEFPADFDPETFEPPDGLPDVTSGGLFGDPLGEAIDAGEVPESRLDDMVARILGGMDRIGLLDGSAEATGTEDVGTVETDEQCALAERIATRGTVLLKNDGVLPLAGDTDLAVVGPNVEEAKLGGGGSSEMTPARQVSPRDGIEARADGTVRVARGVPRIEPVSLFDMLPFAVGEADTTDADAATDVPPSLDEAVTAAEDTDVAVVFVQDSVTEAKDRPDLSLPGDQDALVSAVAAAAERTVVVVNSSSAVEMPWHDDVDAVVEAWYPGQADGDAVASVLFGDVDPGGRLPVTFAATEEYPTADTARHPGVDDEAQYDDGPFVGYRHFEATDTDPLYPFGHGESYTAFEYGSVEVSDERTVRVTVENTGDRDGREVVQAYVRPPTIEDVTRPARELAGFEAVRVPVGESVTVDVTLDEHALGRYDEEAGWTVDSGTYTVEVGRSSRDVRATVILDR